MKKYKGWAIDANSGEGHGFIGRFWWFNDCPPEIPESVIGHRVALFETRVKARRNLGSVRGAFPKAKIVRVEVTVAAT